MSLQWDVTHQHPTSQLWRPIFGFFEVLAVTSYVLQARVCVDDTVFPVRSYGHCFRGLNAHMEATCRGSLLGLVLRWGGFGGLITAGKDNFLSDGTGEPAERAREKFSAFIWDDGSFSLLGRYPRSWWRLEFEIINSVVKFMYLFFLVFHAF